MQQQVPSAATSTAPAAAPAPAAGAAGGSSAAAPQLPWPPNARTPDQEIDDLILDAFLFASDDEATAGIAALFPGQPRPPPFVRQLLLPDLNPPQAAARKRALASPQAPAGAATAALAATAAAGATAAAAVAQLPAAYLQAQGMHRTQPPLPAAGAAATDPTVAGAPMHTGATNGISRGTGQANGGRAPPPNPAPPSTAPTAAAASRAPAARTAHDEFMPPKRGRGRPPKASGIYSKDYAYLKKYRQERMSKLQVMPMTPAGPLASPTLPTPSQLPWPP